MRASHTVVILGLLLVVILGAEASAQAIETESATEAPTAASPETETTAAAQEHFRLGQQAYDETRYRDAARQFQQAYDLSGRAELLYNIGISHERLLNWRATIDAFEMYLSRVPDADNRQNVQARLVLARERLEEASTSPSVESPSSGGNAGPVALLVGGGVLAIGGGVLVGLGASTINDVEATPPLTQQWSDAEQDVSRGNALRTTGVIALSVGVALLGVGVAWLVARKDSNESAWLIDGVRF